VGTLASNAEVARSRPVRGFRLSCVVPVYNEVEVVGAFLDALHATVREITASVELVVVNDGSSDGSAGEILARAGTLPLHYIELSRNFGKEHAIQAGLDAATGDCVVIIDADFQHPIGLIRGMVDCWLRGIDMVYAVKSNRRGEGWLRRALGAAFYRLLSMEAGAAIPRNAGDFRLIDSRVVSVLRALPERTRFMKGLYAWVGFSSMAVSFVPEPRRGGESKYSTRRLARLAFTGLLSFSSLPLRAVSIAGLLISMGALAFGCWIVFEKVFLQQQIPGFATVAASVLLLSGIQLLALGIVGQYVGAIFDEVKGRPPYVTSRSVDTSRGRTGSVSSLSADERNRA
jgi:glycosyltransferase involved in cell wall biosynthesis